MPRWHRLTVDEYKTHLTNADDWFPDKTIAHVMTSGRRQVIDGSHATAYYDAGWFWVKTDNLRVQI
jgi:hypothetical protein